MVWLPFHELPRGGHPVAPLSHNAVQAHDDPGLRECGLAFQSAARDPLVREDGHLFFSVLSSAALAVIAAAASRAATESGVVAFSES